MPASLADPGAQCSDVRNMALSIEGVKNVGCVPPEQGRVGMRRTIIDHAQGVRCSVERRLRRRQPEPGAWPLPNGLGGYFPACQSCLDAVISEAQLSGGFPRASILAKIVYGSFLLPEERSVDWSLTQAYTITLALAS